MSNIAILKRDQFDTILDALNELNIKNRDLVYEIYMTASEGMDELIQTNILPSVGMVNPVDILYIHASNNITEVLQLVSNGFNPISIDHRKSCF